MANKKSAADLRTHLTSFAPEYPVKKGYVAQLLMDPENRLCDIVRKVKALVLASEQDKFISEDNLNHSIRRFKSKFLAMRTNLTGNWTSLVSLLIEPFHVHLKDLNDSFPQQPEPVLFSTAVQPPSCSDSSSLVRSPSPKKMRRDCHNCSTQRRTIANLSKTNIMVQQKLKDKIIQLRKELASTSRKEFNQSIKRKKTSIDAWKAKYRSSKVDKSQLVKLKSQLQTVLDENKIMKEKEQEYKSTIEELKKSLCKERRDKEKSGLDFANRKRKMLIKMQDNDRQYNRQIRQANKDSRDEIAHWQCEFDRVEEEREDDHVVEVKVNNKTYGPKIRKCIMMCLLCNVSVKKCSLLIEYIAKHLFSKKLSDLPRQTMVGQMMYEIGVLSDIQAGHALYNSKYSNLAWDATSLKGAHVNEIHINTITNAQNQKLVLSVFILSDGTAESYYQHIVQTLLDVVKTYSVFHGLPEKDVREKILNNISSTLSDRAVVNRCVTELLEERLNMELLELKCNVHPLDGLARAALDALAKLQPQTSGKSPGCKAADVIHKISKMRYKQGTGDPAGFRMFLVEKKLKSNVILRYVGNRLNVLFHMAATVFNLQSQLLAYFTLDCRRDNLLKNDIVKYLEDSDVLIQLRALGLYSKILTGPWMHKMYTSENQLSHLQAVTEGHFITCLQSLQRIKEKPEIILTCTDVFGQSLHASDSVLSSLRDVKDGVMCPALRAAVLTLATTFIDKLSSQLDEYLTGKLSKPSGDMLTKAAAAPVHNMHAERTLGMVDALWRRAPNAQPGFIDGKVKAVMNSTLEWLSSFDEAEQSRLFSFAIRHGAETRQAMADRKKVADEALAKKLASLAQRREEQHRKSREKIIKDAIAQKVSLRTLDIFAGLDEKVKDRLVQFFEDEKSLLGTEITHSWYVDGETVEYCERVQKFITRNNQRCIALSCWLLEDRTESEYWMPVSQFLADISFGDIRFV